MLVYEGVAWWFGYLADMLLVIYLSDVVNCVI